MRAKAVEERGFKTCKQCGQEKPLEKYSMQNGSWRARCNPCLAKNDAAAKRRR